MATPATTDQTLRAENAELRARLEEAEDALRAIRSGEVDTLVVEGDAGPQLFTLQGLDAEQNRLRGAVLAQVSDAVVTTDREDRITFLNPAAEQQYRVRSADVLGRKLSELYTSQWPTPQAEAAGLAALEERGHWCGEKLHHTGDGCELPVEASIAILHDPETGQRAGWITAIRDITERKRAEEDLRESEHFLQRITEVTPGVLHVFDLEKQRSVFVSRAVASVIGYSAEEIAAMGSEVIPTLMHPDDLPRFAAHMERVRTLGDDEYADFEHRMRAKSGEWCWFQNRDAVFTRDAAGAVRQTIGAAMDITARKEADLALREAKDAAEAANAAKDRFLAVLGHELRTPLTPVLMAVAALEHDPELRGEVREDMAMIKRNIELEVKLIDDLLDVSRIASGKVPLKLAPVDLNGAVREVCASFRAQLLERQVRLALELSEDVGIISADATRLHQVLSNVFRNAVKFTPEAGIVQVTTARLGPCRCEIRVRDSGIGIAPEALSHIFEAFEQGDARVTRQFGGLGLGLTIAKALIELHGGLIRAESAGSGKGATFILELPDDHPVPATAVPPLALERAEPARLRLLIVEDHADTARALSRLLAKAGFAVSTASDVATALALAGRETFDLLVSDLGLPDGTGCDVMAGLQKVQPLPGIALSGYGMDEDAAKTRAAGFREHLVKPIEVPKLIAAIRRVTESQA